MESFYTSLAGRATLIKSVTSCIPNHIMQANLLPAFTMEVIDKPNTKFLWGNDNNNKKIHLISWDNVCKSRDAGGIGIRRCNLTMLLSC